MSRTGRDRAVIAICLFFIAMASSVELWWLHHTPVLTARESWLAVGFGFYGAGDRGYFDQVAHSRSGLRASTSMPPSLSTWP